MPLNTAYIRARRDQLQLTAQEAATRAGWGKTSANTARVKWSELEHGRYADLRLSTLEQIAAALQCRVQDLLLPVAKAQNRRRPSGSAGSNARP